MNKLQVTGRGYQTAAIEMIEVSKLVPHPDNPAFVPAGGGGERHLRTDQGERRDLRGSATRRMFRFWEKRHHIRSSAGISGSKARNVRT